VRSSSTVNIPNQEDKIMLNRIKTTVGTIVMTGMLVLPTWAQSPFPPPQPPPPGSGCPNIVSEQEPNSIDQPQDVGIVDQANCLTLSASITTGYDNFDQPNPNADIDAFVLQVAAGSSFQVSYEGIDQTDEFMTLWVDLQSGELLEMVCSEGQADGTLQCEGFSPSGILGTAFASRLPEDYSMTVTLGGSTFPSAVTDSGMSLSRSSSNPSSYLSDGSDLLDLMDRLR
jgi:hypothetical protein